MMKTLLHGIYTVIILQISKPLEVYASAEVLDRQSTFRCMNNLGFPKGTEERLFKTLECGNNRSIKADCSSEVVKKIDHLNYSKPAYAAEDFIYFVSTFKKVWNLLKDGQISGNATVCWDVAAMEKMVQEFEFLEQYYVWNTKYIVAVVVIEVIFGLTANSLVLFIFFKYKEMRTQSNMIILNLAIADILLIASICFGSIVVFFYPVTALLYGFCRPIVFTINFASFGSVHSMVTLTFLRFMAVSATPGSRTLYFKKKFLKTPVIITSAWVISSVSGIPYVLDANENCVSKFDPELLTFGLVFFCMVPFLIATGLSIATTRRLKRSAKDMPGNGLDCEKWARERGAKVIIVLIVAFALTYVPPVFFSIIATQVDYKYNYAGYIHGIIMLLNTCINPVGLFISSAAFRKHLKLMLPSGCMTLR